MQFRTSVILALAATLLAGSAWAHHNMRRVRRVQVRS